MKHLTPSRMPLQRDYRPFVHLWNRKGVCFLFVSEGREVETGGDRTRNREGNNKLVINTLKRCNHEE